MCKWPRIHTPNRGGGLHRDLLSPAHQTVGNPLLMRPPLLLSNPPSTGVLCSHLAAPVPSPHICSLGILKPHGDSSFTASQLQDRALRREQRAERAVQHMVGNATKWKKRGTNTPTVAKPKPKGCILIPDVELRPALPDLPCTPLTTWVS